MEKLDEQNTGNNNSEQPMGKDVGTICTAAYVFFIGWIISYVMWSDKNKNNKNSLTTFHIRQALGTNILIIAAYFLTIFTDFIPYIGGLISLALYVLVIAILIIGLMSGSSKEEKKFPVFGDMFQDWFKGIN